MELRDFVVARSTQFMVVASPIIMATSRWAVRHLGSMTTMKGHELIILTEMTKDYDEGEEETDDYDDDRGQWCRVEVQLDVLAHAQEVVVVVVAMVCNRTWWRHDMETSYDEETWGIS